MARFKLLLTPPKTPPVALWVITFKGNKERNNEYNKT